MKHLLSVMVCVIASNANIGNCRAFRWILLHFYNLSNSAACITMSFWPPADVNDAVRFVVWLHKVGLQLFRLKFVVFSFNVASEVTEIGRISVVMPVSD